MTHRALVTALALATTGASHAGLMQTWNFTCSAQGQASFSSLGSLDMQLSLTFDAGASVFDSANAITAWSYRVTRSEGGEVVFEASGSPTAGQNTAAYSRFTVGSVTTRKYTISLGGVTASSWKGSAAGSGLLPVTLVQVGFVAARSGSSYGSLAESFQQSQGSAGGVLMVAGNSVPGEFGAINGIGYAVPAPGLMSLAGVAGVVIKRRRRS